MRPALLTALATLVVVAAATPWGLRDARPVDAAPHALDTLEELGDLSGADAYEVAVQVSEARFGEAAADYAVVASGEQWPDALAGSALSDRGPLLLSGRDDLPAGTERELRRAVGEGGLVYLLGGPEAIGEAIDDRLDELGLRTRRLAGATRVETALAVADEVTRVRGVPPRTAALARAHGPQRDPTAGWVDAITVSAWIAAEGVPLLLTTGDELDDGVSMWLAAQGVERTVLVGGPAALDEGLEADVPDPERVGGVDRADTARAIARQLWGQDQVDSTVLVNGYDQRGWAHALPAAALAGAHGAPMLLTAAETVPRATWASFGRCPVPDMMIAGGRSTDADALRTSLRTVCTEGRRVDVGVATPAGFSDLGEVEAFERATGARTGIVMQFDHWGLTLPDADGMDAVAARGAVPMVAWEPWMPGEGAEQPEYRLRRIADGAHDDYLRRAARILRAHEGPVLLRFAHEMNGDWYPWAAGVNGNEARDYVDAWRHVHEIFAEERADDVAWVWSPNVDYPGATPLEELYPGDEYVDWVGASGYNGGTTLDWGGWRSFDDLFDDTLDRLEALAPGKPLMITETGSAEQGGDKAAWIDGFFRGLERRSQARAFVWFEFDKETDWRVTSSEASAHAFGTAVSHPRYGE